MTNSLPIHTSRPTLFRPRRLVSLAVMVLVAPWLLQPAAGQLTDAFWQDVVGGSFQDGTHWSINQEPDTDNRAIFDMADSYTVTFEDNAATGALRFDAGTVTFDISDGVDSFTYNAGPVDLNGGNLTLIMGTLSSGGSETWLENATLQVTGVGTEWIGSEEFRMRHNTNLILNGGASMTLSDDFMIAWGNDEQIDVNISGAGTQLTITGSKHLRIGRGRVRGEMVVSDQAQVNIGGQLDLGWGDRQNASFPGYTVRVESGGEISVGANLRISSQDRVGNTGGVENTLEITGTDSLVEVQDYVWVGERRNANNDGTGSNTGILHMLNGGVMRSGLSTGTVDVSIGYGDAGGGVDHGYGIGEVLIDGAGSRWEIGTQDNLPVIRLGRQGGIGSVEVRDQGLLDSPSGDIEVLTEESELLITSTQLGTASGRIEAGSLSFVEDSLFRLTLSDADAGQPLITLGEGSFFVSGLLDPGLANLELDLVSGYNPAVNTEFILVNYGDWSGEFFKFDGQALTNGEIFEAAGQLFQVDYGAVGGAGALTLTVIPEPHSVVLGLLALAILLRRRR